MLRGSRPKTSRARRAPATSLERLYPWRNPGVARILFWAAALFAFVMAVLPHPPQLPGEPDDKVQHVLAFTTLTVLGAWAFRATPSWKLLTGLSLFGAAIEVVQAIPILHRDCEFLDWVADTAAVAVVLLLIGATRRWRSG